MQESYFYIRCMFVSVIFRVLLLFSTKHWKRQIITVQKSMKCANLQLWLSLSTGLSFISCCFIRSSMSLFTSDTTHLRNTLLMSWSYAMFFWSAQLRNVHPVIFRTMGKVTPDSLYHSRPTSLLRLSLAQPQGNWAVLESHLVSDMWLQEKCNSAKKSSVKVLCASSSRK